MRHAFLAALGLASLSVVASVGAPGCGGEVDVPPSPSAATFRLVDDVEVAVSSTGGITLRASDGRVVFATTEGARITARTFSEYVQGFTGIWSFEREGEAEFPAGRYASLAGSPEEVVLRFDGGPAQAEVDVRIKPHRTGSTLVRFEVRLAEGAEAQSIAVPIACDEEATFYGFGEQYDAPEHRGHAFELFVSEQGMGREPGAGRALAGDQHTTYFPMPWFFDARGFGVLAKTAYRTLVDLCATDPTTAWMEVESGAPLELLVFHGPRPLDVIRQLGDELGRPRVPPAWAFGTWISAQGGRDAVLARAAKVLESNIPATAIWSQDWTGERRNLDGGYGVQYRWVADEERYPDLRGMISELRDRGLRFLGYANPFVVPGLEHYDAMASGDMLLRRQDGSVYDHIAPNGAAATPDFSNEATYGYVGDAFRDMVGRLGMDGFMADFGEWAPLDAVYASGADPRAEHNLYPVRWHTSWRRALDELRPDGDYVVFARSGYTGVQAVAQIYWVGDQEATFSPYDGLPTVVPAMMSLGFAGIPFVTHDVAGFSGGPSTKELYMRWTELGAFSPILRTHDGNRKDVNWSWDRDAETTEHFARMSTIHARLVPELLVLAEEAGTTGTPLVRHLVLEYPDDPNSRTTHDQYLLGKDLLVAPVTTAGATSRHVYFPPGDAWFHVFTGEKFEGGTTAEVPAPIGTPAVFARGADRDDLRAP